MFLLLSYLIQRERGAERGGGGHCLRLSRPASSVRLDHAIDSEKALELDAFWFNATGEPSYFSVSSRIPSSRPLHRARRAIGVKSCRGVKRPPSTSVKGKGRNRLS